MARRPHPTHRLPEAIRYAKTGCRPFERTPCVRNVLTTSSTEVPEEASACVVGIHSCNDLITSNAVLDYITGFSLN